jgi:hypothetical protein
VLFQSSNMWLSLVKNIYREELSKCSSKYRFKKDDSVLTKKTITPLCAWQYGCLVSCWSQYKLGIRSKWILLSYVVVDIRAWVHSIKAGVAAWEESMREKYSKSLLGKYLIRKESSCIRKGLDLFVLEEVKVLNIHYIRMTCIHVGNQARTINLISPWLFSLLNLCLPNPSQPRRLAISSAW